MGCLRFVLALLVVVSHGGISIYDHNPGVSAVIVFFIISGFVMTKLIDRHYASFDRIGAFYLDRAARIYPQFLVYLAASVIAIGALGLSSAFFSKCSSVKIALNMMVLPQGYSQLFGIGKCLPVPQAWSLGLELTFYTVLPFLLIVPVAAPVAVVASLAVAVIAALGVVNTDIWGYRLLPGTLFIFLLGVAWARGVRWYPAVIWLTAIGVYAAIFVQPHLWGLPYTKEVMLGIILGLPSFIIALRVPATRIDALLGDLSYGIFLNHFLLVMIYQRYDVAFTLLAVPTLMVASVVLSYLSYALVEAPVLKWRHGKRNAQQIDIQLSTYREYSTQPPPA